MQNDNIYEYRIRYDELIRLQCGEIITLAENTQSTYWVYTRGYTNENCNHRERGGLMDGTADRRSISFLWQAMNIVFMMIAVTMLPICLPLYSVCVDVNM